MFKFSKSGSSRLLNMTIGHWPMVIWPNPDHIKTASRPQPDYIMKSYDKQHRTVFSSSSRNLVFLFWQKLLPNVELWTISVVTDICILLEIFEICILLEIFEICILLEIFAIFQPMIVGCWQRIIAWCERFISPMGANN